MDRRQRIAAPGVSEGNERLIELMGTGAPMASAASCEENFSMAGLDVQRMENVENCPLDYLLATMALDQGSTTRNLGTSLEGVEAVPIIRQ
ncbi:hypothetical protein NB693_23260 [Pantoea ananatis]|uniref:hypothetical protein n=1 Tax=Pantoea ananas TaxID=553 RepID=UPI002220FAA2|nr:hypothetical protein [Pantoea ananatis]